MKNLILVVSTGRCGTQWLARHLGELYPEVAEVTHEPLGPHYRPGTYFRAYEDPRRQLDEEPIRSHMARVAEVLETRTYIETGWPHFAAIPLFIELFGERVRLVHLVRHPVPTSISHSVHQTYFGSPRVDDYTRLATLHPAMPGVFQQHLTARWDTMSPFEKCLFWWTELNLYALELAERFPAVPYLFVRAEEMLAGDSATIAKLTGHIGLPDSDALARRADRVEDNWNHRTDRDLDWRTIRDYPAALELAERFGYRADEIDPAALAARYEGRPSPG